MTNVFGLLKAPDRNKMTDAAFVFDPTATQTAMRRRCIWLIYGATAFWGVAQVVAAESAAIYMLAVLLIASAATCWAVLDARLAGRRMSAIVPPVYFFLWPVASLVYLLWSRGWRGLAIWAIHVVCLSATLAMTFYPTVILLYSLGVIDVAPDGTIQDGG